MTTFIYALCEPNSNTIRYIGKANNPQQRLVAHLSHSIKVDNHLGRWLQSLKAVGSKPKLVVLREVFREDWQMAEERFIRLARGCRMDLVNATDGGEGLHNPSPETLRKMSQPKSLEHCANIASAQKGRIGPSLSLQTRAKISASSKGKILTPEHCVNIALSKIGDKNPNFGKCPSPETRAKMSTAHKGRLFSLETRAKLSKALKGVPKSPEHCAKISAAKRLANALKKKENLS